MVEQPKGGNFDEQNKAAFIFITLLWIFCLFPLKTEASLHPYFYVQEFYDNYNFWIEQSYQRDNNAHKMPFIESLTSSEEEPWEFYGDFDDTFPNAKIFISTNRLRKITSIHIVKEIEEFTQINGKTFPQDIFKLSKVAGAILFGLEYPTGTNEDRQRVADVIAEAAYNYDNDNTYLLYNPMRKISYKVFFRTNGEKIIFFMQNYD